MITKLNPEQQSIRKRLLTYFSDEHSVKPFFAYDTKNRYLLFSPKSASYNTLLQILYTFYFGKALNPYQAYTNEDPFESFEVQWKLKKTGLKINSYAFLESTRKSASILFKPGWLRFGLKSNPYHRIFSAWKDYFFVGSPCPERAELFKHLAKDNFVEFEDFVNHITSNTSQDSLLSLAYQPIYEDYPLIRWYDTDDLASWIEGFKLHLANAGQAHPVLEFPKVHEHLPLGDFRDFYTQAIADKVYDAYRKDFEFFGYEQESWYLDEKRDTPLKRGADCINWFTRELEIKNRYLSAHLSAQSPNMKLFYSLYLLPWKLRLVILPRLIQERFFRSDKNPSI